MDKYMGISETSEKRNQRIKQRIFLTIIIAIVGLLCSCENKSSKESPDETTYIDLQEEIEIEKNNENLSIQFDIDIKEILKEEIIYQSAIEAENNYYYAYAFRLFSPISDYRDSTEHIESLKGILEPYDGDYTVEMFAGGTYKMSIQNGSIQTKMDVDNSPVYYSDIIGYTFDGKNNTPQIAMAFSHDPNANTILSSDDYDDEVYLLHEMDNGGYMIIAAEGNEHTYWNGSTKSLYTHSKIKSTNEEKIKILETVKKALENYEKGCSFVLYALSSVDRNSDINYTIAYFTKTYQYEKEYIYLSIEDWNTAINLCGTYSDTQTMKSYLTQLVDKFSPLLDYDISTDNIIEYMQYRETLSISELQDMIISEMDLWVKDAIMGNH